MKRLIQIAALIVAGFTASISPAKAGVPCSVPFNLTNGTTADATQVMANYNAILSCLSTSAAANGNNSDITSLGAVTSIGPLSTPITPAQGGAQALCGANGFQAVNDSGTPNTEIDIVYTQALVVSSTGVVQRGASGVLVLNLGTSGAANGLDTGSLAASTFYYIYLIGNGSVIASLASLSSTAPTLPAGYTYSCRVGVWETNTLSQLLPLKTFGRRTILNQDPNVNTTAGFFQATTTIGNCAGGGTVMVLTTFGGIPPTALRVFGSTYGVSTAAHGIFVSSYSAVGTGQSRNVYGQNGTTPTSHLLFDLVIPSAQQFYVCNDDNLNSVSIGGWEDSVNAN